MSGLTITVCGCGNGAHACAALMSLKGHTVNLFSTLQDEIDLFRRAYEENGGFTVRIGSGLLSGLEGVDKLTEIETHERIQIGKISANASEVIPQSSIIFIVVPSFAHNSIIKSIKPFLSSNSLLVFLPSRGGLEFEINAFLPRASVMAFQTLPWATRIRSFGKEVLISARKKSIYAAASPSDLSEIFFYQLENLLEMEIVRVKNMFTLTLSNIGQIVHPGIMYSIFKKNPHALYPADALPLFYQGVDEEGGRLLSRMSDEVRTIATVLSKTIPSVELDKVLHIRDWLMLSYRDQIADTSSVCRMIVTNRAYEGLKAPLRQTGDGLYTPDFSSRYITEDIPYGLLVTKSIGTMVNVETPAIDEVLLGIGSWTGHDYMGRLKNAKEISATSRLPEAYGINNIKDLASQLC